VTGKPGAEGRTDPAGTGNGMRKRRGPDGRFASGSPPATAPAETAIFAAGRQLETARTQWQYGAWDDLARLDEAQISADPDRAKLAALVAAAHSHLGNLSAARRFARVALAWGCERQILARVLISAARNSLGRVSIALQEPEAARAQFHDAIRLVEPRADIALLARTREVRETARIGLLPEALTAISEELESLGRDPVNSVARVAALNADVALLRHRLQILATQPPATLQGPTGTESFSAEAPAWTDAVPAVAGNPLFDPAALATLRAACEDRAAPLLYLDSKSLPRSGLHYLRETLNELLGPDFSFCEWYLEPGCCRRMPCALMPFQRDAKNLRLRLLKSHDFDLEDPDFPIGPGAHRIILLRDPLYVLTSWWTLQILYDHEKLLKDNFIDINKISYLHEATLVRQAHELVARKGLLPHTSVLEEFLTAKCTYINRFVHKWADAPTRPNVQVVAYSDIPRFVVALLRSRSDDLSAGALARLQAYETGIEGSFRPRSDPFDGPTPEIAEMLRLNSELFLAAAAKATDADRTGWLRRAAARKLENDPPRS
jgi:tetratricopeptide (TPR) repeat protein